MFLFWCFHFSFREISLSSYSVLCQVLAQIGCCYNNIDLFSELPTLVIDASKTKGVYPICRGAIRERKENPTARASQRESQPLNRGENLAAKN